MAASKINSLTKQSAVSRSQHEIKCDVVFCTFVSFFIPYNNFSVFILIIRILLLCSIKLSITSAMQQSSFLLFRPCPSCYLNEMAHKLCKNICICIFAFMIFIVNFIRIKLSARVRLRNRTDVDVPVFIFSFFIFSYYSVAVAVAVAVQSI